MYVQKNVKLTTSTDLGLIRTCAGAHADGIRYSSEEEAETARGFVARGRGPRSKAMHYLLTGACHVVSVDSGNGCHRGRSQNKYQELGRQPTGICC